MTTRRKSSLDDRCFSETRRIKGWILIPDSFSGFCCASLQCCSQSLWYPWCLWMGGTIYISLYFGVLILGAVPPRIFTYVHYSTLGQGCEDTFISFFYFKPLLRREELEWRGKDSTCFKCINIKWSHANMCTMQCPHTCNRIYRSKQMR